MIKLLYFTLIICFITNSSIRKSPEYRVMSFISKLNMIGRAANSSVSAITHLPRQSYSLCDQHVRIVVQWEFFPHQHVILCRHLTIKLFPAESCSGNIAKAMTSGRFRIIHYRLLRFTFMNLYCLQVRRLDCIQQRSSRGRDVTP